MPEMIFLFNKTDCCALQPKAAEQLVYSVQWVCSTVHIMQAEEIHDQENINSGTISSSSFFFFF